MGAFLREFQHFAEQEKKASRRQHRRGNSISHDFWRWFLFGVLWSHLKLAMFISACFYPVESESTVGYTFFAFEIWPKPLASMAIRIFYMLQMNVNFSCEKMTTWIQKHTIEVNDKWIKRKDVACYGFFAVKWTKNTSNRKKIYESFLHKYLILNTYSEFVCNTVHISVVLFELWLFASDLPRCFLFQNRVYRICCTHLGSSNLLF